jgi:acyl carrier protein
MNRSQTPDANGDAKTDTILGEVKSVIIRAVNLHHIDPETITEKTTLGPDGLNLDSIDVLEVVLAVERHFDVKVENTEKGRDYFSSMGNIAKFVAQQKAGTTA